MTMIAGCPRCSTELLVPAEAPETSSLECPVCGAKFSRGSAATRRLPLARVISPAPVDDDDQDFSDSAVATIGSSAAELSGEDGMASLSARLRSLQGATAAHLGEHHASSMSRLLGGSNDSDEPMPAACGDDASDSDDAGDSAEVAAEIDALLKAAAAGERYGDAIAADEPPDGDECQLDTAADELPARADGASDASADAEMRGEPAADPEPSAGLDRLVGQFLLDPASRVKENGEMGLPVNSAAPIPPAFHAPDSRSVTESYQLRKFDEGAEASASADDASARVDAGMRMIRAAMPRRRRSRARGVRLVAGAAVFGLIGILAGGYVLLWIAGSRGDLLRLASVLPDGMLPPSMQSLPADDQPVIDGDVDAMPGLAARESGDDASAAPLEPPIADEPDPYASPLPSASGGSRYTLEQDGAVTPAAANLPTEPAQSQPAPRDVDALSAAAQALGAPRTTIDEISIAVEEAAAELPGLLVRDLPDRQSAARTGRAYIALARMAERLNLAAADADPNALITQQLLAKDILRQATAESSGAGVLTQVAMKWIEYDKRPSHGVVLRGVVRDMQAAGPNTLHVLELTGGELPAPRQVLVLMSPEGRRRLGDELAVAGVLVPADVEALEVDRSGGRPLIFSNCAVPLTSR